MKHSKSLSTLISELKNLPENATMFDRYRVVENHPISLADVEKYVISNHEHYNRKHFELNNQFHGLILTWMPGQKSPIHNHSGSQCIVCVLSGEAIETVFDVNKDGSFSTSSKPYPNGSILYGEDADIHVVENSISASENLVTMHFYFPGLVTMEHFKMEGNRLLADHPHLFNL